MMMSVPVQFPCLALFLAVVVAAAQPAVHVDSSKLQGPRVLEEQTRLAAVRDYLDAWRSMSSSLQQNRPGPLDRDFVGPAQEKLAGTVAQQARVGIRTRYTDLSHDLQFVFYDPRGLSIEMVDNAEYEVQVFDHDKALAAQRVHARYVIVLTPAELRWKVRVFQASPQA
jgi:hypothetical protein